MRKRVRGANSRITALVISTSVWYASVRVANTGTESVRTSGGRCVAAPRVWYPQPDRHISANGINALAMLRITQSYLEGAGQLLLGRCGMLFTDACGSECSGRQSRIPWP